MKDNKTKTQEFKSLKKFEEKYFPKSAKKQSREQCRDSNSFGVCLAKESIELIRHHLSQQ